MGNPTFSLAIPGPAPLGMPNFFIDSFRVPPFMLPIYQAAGIEYDVPWQVLAAINEIETDYGRNLSVSSAGAVGWMQFLPSTWKQYAVDANGDGVADLLLQSQSTGQIAIWFMNAVVVTDGRYLSLNAGPAWKLVAPR